MIVKCSDGEIFEGRNATDIVRQMKNSEWNAPNRKRDYMLEVIERVEDMTGVFVNQDLLPTHADSDELIRPIRFLQYLESVRLLEIEN